eukprot:jgi/Botrbrau1/3120/Bobra.0070s0094.1
MRSPQGVLLVLAASFAIVSSQNITYPVYLANSTTYGSIATQWNQVAQLAVARNRSGPINAATTFFLLSQCVALTRNAYGNKGKRQNQMSSVIQAINYAAYQALRYIRPESEAFYKEKFAQLTAAGYPGLDPALVGTKTNGNSPPAVANAVCSKIWAVRGPTFVNVGINDTFPFVSTNPFTAPTSP